MTTATPPVAKKLPYVVKSPNGDRNDPYYWMRDDERTDPEILALLKAEQRYTLAAVANLEPLKKTIYDEIVARIKQDDESVPFRYRSYYYYNRFVPGGEYEIEARRADRENAAEEILLDGNALSKGHEYFDLGEFAISPDGRMMAWTEDTQGRHQYTIRFRDLATGQTLADELPGNDSEIVWAADNKTVFYIEKDPVTLLGTRVRRHTLGTSPAADPVVYEEEDDSFYLSLGLTGDDRFVTIHASSTVSDEIRYLPVDQPAGEFAILLPRQRDHEYDADHIDDRWLIRTNDVGPNFRLVETQTVAASDKAGWRELVAHNADVYLAEFDVFDEFIAVAERREGLRSLRVLDRDGKLLFPIAADDPVSAMDIDTNMEQATDWLRYSYSSLTTPETIYEINVRTAERRLLKQQPVLGGFSSDNYDSARLWVESQDGKRIPVSLLFRRDAKPSATSPVYLTGYGAYGISSDPTFEDEILSLVDRGFVYAIAHVRGGQELGRAWYEDGKLLNKRNTFEDFITVAEALIEQGFADPRRIVASGGSAGGMLVAAVANMRPDLFRVIIADVPFVDVVTTMLDPTIPLTTGEYDEWGNPADPEFYRYMLSYSPYDNVVEQAYPGMLVSTGLWDSQVQYYEPAKWVARLRALKTDSNPLIFNINMDAGHGGESGRFRKNQNLALEFAFAVEQTGLATKP